VIDAGGFLQSPIGAAGRADAALQHEVEQFLYDEAALVDERRFDEWLGCFAEDVHYWMPVRTSRMPREMALEIDGADGNAYFDDDLAHLRVRIRKLKTDRSWSEAPASRTRHLVANVRITVEDDATLAVRSNILVYRSRGESTEDLLAGSRADRLRRRPDGGLEIFRRHILLEQSVLLANNLSIFF
jgi:3-phenylpropionate/cinnamic acid dioxygenase small subunit